MYDYSLAWHLMTQDNYITDGAHSVAYASLQIYLSPPMILHPLALHFLSCHLNFHVSVGNAKDSDDSISEREEGQRGLNEQFPRVISRKE